MIFTYESNYLYKIIIILSIVTAECSLAIRSRKFSKENYKKKKTMTRIKRFRLLVKLVK